MRTIFTIFLASILSTISMAASVDSLDIKIGQMIMIGIGDRTSLTSSDPFAEEIRQGKVGGVVLFEKNLSQSNTPARLKQMIQNLQKEATIPLFVSIDEEGGRVHRLKSKYGFIDIPSAADLGRADSKEQTLSQHRKLAALLADLGINLNYAPSVDVAVNPNNTVIVKNERSFGADPELVAKHAALVIKAHHEHGVKTVLKHFPGHGSSTGDSHYGVVDVSKTWHMKELEPYLRLVKGSEVDGIMTAHIVNKNWDPSKLPATLSKKVVTDMLRNVIGHQGVVFSDDMQMQAISSQYGWENAIALAINAGVDVLMFGNTLDRDKMVSPGQIHGIIKNLVVTKKVPAERIDESYQRIIAMKNKTYQ